MPIRGACCLSASQIHKCGSDYRILSRSGVEYGDYVTALRSHFDKALQCHSCSQYSQRSWSSPRMLPLAPCRPRA